MSTDVAMLLAAFAILAFIIACGALIVAFNIGDEIGEVRKALAAEVELRKKLERRHNDLARNHAELAQRFRAGAPRRRGQDLPEMELLARPAGLRVVDGGEQS